MAETLTIETRSLRKQYDEVEALRALDLAVPPGAIFGFLGRNGAGKTTTIKVLLGMTRPTSGTALVFGQPANVPAASVGIRRRIGFVADDKALYGTMTVADMIGFTAAFFPRWRRDLEQRYVRAFELPLERMARDVRMFTIGGGTAQVLRTLIASRMLGWKLPQTRDGYRDRARPLAAE